MKLACSVLQLRSGSCHKEVFQFRTCSLAEAIYIRKRFNLGTCLQHQTTQWQLPQGSASISNLQFGSSRCMRKCFYLQTCLQHLATSQLQLLQGSVSTLNLQIGGGRSYGSDSILKLASSILQPHSGSCHKEVFPILSLPISSCSLYREVFLF